MDYLASNMSNRLSEKPVETGENNVKKAAEKAIILFKILVGIENSFHPF